MIPAPPASPPRRWRPPAGRVLMSNNGGGGGSAGPQAVSPELVGAMVPAQILQEDEIVLLLTKPSLFFLFYSSFRFLVATLLLGVIAGQIPRISVSTNPSMIALITVLVCVGRLVWALLVWTSHIYMLTNRRILTIKGVINVGMFQAYLRKIQNVQLYRPIGQRVFAAGTIGFSTAAAAGAAESTWVMIARPQETHEQVMAAISKAR